MIVLGSVAYAVAISQNSIAFCVRLKFSRPSNMKRSLVDIFHSANRVEGYKIYERDNLWRWNIYTQWCG